MWVGWGALWLGWGGLMGCLGVELHGRGWVGREREVVDGGGLMG